MTVVKMSLTNNSEINTSSYNEENDLFYLESENYAIKGNKDYNELMQTIKILEAQRAGAVKDIDKIIEIQKVALEDPAAFIEKIKNNEDLGIPSPQKIAEVPVINWSKYNVSIPEESLKLIDADMITENKIAVPEPRKPKNLEIHDTFNKNWTSEEQKRLEELLIQFPPEAIEMRRYKKIAAALGNRTVKQVTSRLQKYFLKLYKAGLPIPGRIPKISDKKKPYLHKHQKHNAYLYKPSTFFPALDVPVHIAENDDDDDSMPGSGQRSEKFINAESKKEQSDIQIKINLLKRIKMEKEKETHMVTFTHTGFKCDICNEEPIIGTRWHCYDCNTISVDFCTDCMIAQIQNENNCHPLTHNLQAVQTEELDTEMVNSSDVESRPKSSGSASSSEEEEVEDADSELESSQENSSDSDTNSLQYYDKDYISEFGSSLKSYNYLDPNFLPE